MPHYVWCPTDAQKATPEYRSNTIALWIIFGVSIFVLIWYIAASHEARTKVRRCGVAGVRNTQWFQANLLSGMLVSLLVVSILYTSFPEPIEATFVVVLALSQASALGWLDFPPGAEFWDVFCTKLPDVFALGLTLWAVWDAMERYFEANGNRNAKNAPMVLRNPWIPFAVCSVVNEAVMMVMYQGWLVERNRREEKRIRKFSRNLEIHAATRSHMLRFFPRPHRYCQSELQTLHLDWLGDIRCFQYCWCRGRPSICILGMQSFQLCTLGSPNRSPSWYDVFVFSDFSTAARFRCSIHAMTNAAILGACWTWLV